MTIIDDAQLAGYLAQRSVAGVLIEITVGADSIEVLAIPGRSSHELDFGDGRSQSLQTKDWLILAEDLDFGDGPIEPSRHWRVSYNDSIYAALDIGGEPPFRYMGQERAMVRLHTKEVF